MPTLAASKAVNSGRARADAGAVLQALREYCERQETGAVFPSRAEWMNRLNASERSVRWALDELQRQGRIVRPAGARTFVVAEPPQSNGTYQTATVEEAGEGATSRTVVAVTVPDHALFDQAMKLLVLQCEEAELSVTCHLLPWGQFSIANLPVMKQEPLGYIILRRDLLPLAEELQAAGHRTVFVGTPYVGQIPKVPTVYGHHEQGGYLATQHLLELGHRRVAFCAYGDVEQTQRWRGHQRAVREMRKRGIEVQDEFLAVNDVWSWADNLNAATAYFDRPQAPTGIAVWNDHEAAILLSVLHRIGVRVPDDVSLVGYDNLPEGRLVHPALTTVHSPIDQQLQAALGVLTQPDPVPDTYQLVIFPGLIQRDSSAAWGR